MCLCVCVCLHFLRSYILLLHPIVLCVFAYNYLHTHKIYEKEIEEGEKRRRTGEKIISGASSLVQDHQNETGALQMRYQCLWITISPFPEPVFLIVFPLLWTALKENHSQYFLGGISFHFFPVFPKDSSFLLFFANSQVPHIADDLKQSLPWRKIPGGIIKKKKPTKRL